MMLAAAASLSAAAAPVAPEALAARHSVTKVSATLPANQAVKKFAPGVSVSTVCTPRGVTVKKLNAVVPNRVINPAVGVRAKAKAPASASFFDSFEYEALDGSPWTLDSKGQQTEGTQWALDDGTLLSFAGAEVPDGEKAAFINFNSDPIEEWLISPELTVAQDDKLSFWAYFPAFFFNSMDNLDWDTFEYIGDPVRIGDIEVMIRHNGGEWSKLFSLMDQYDGVSAAELMYAGIETWSVSLAGHEGENVQVAFKYWGTDCNTAAIDAVTVAPPSLEGVSAMEPLEMLYFGSDRSAGWSSLNLTLAIAPVQTPLTWMNYSDYVEGATYSWTFHDPVTNDWAVSDEQDLTRTYQTDFSSDFTRRNNLYYAPVLTGSAPGASDGSFSRGYTYFQAGGKPEFAVNDGQGGQSIMEFGLMSYPQNVDGNTIAIFDVDEIGAAAMPVFGHDANTDKFWLASTLNGSEPSEGDYVKLNGFCNYVAAPGKPLVVTGAHALAIGKITDAASFRCDIYALDEDGVADDANIIATAQCPASKVQIYEQGTNDLLNIIFDFDEPVILDNVKAQAYFVKISGFNSDAVTYFAPVQSELPEPNQMCLGWVEKKIFVDGGPERQSFSPIARIEGENGPMYNAFAINLDGFYPFLACDTDEVEISDEQPAVISLGSFYDAEDLDIDAPAGIRASATGRYDSCLLTLTAADNAEGDVTVSAPGVKHVIHVKATSGIVDITAGNVAEITEVYTLDGRRIGASEARPGLYVIRRADGSAAKARIR